MFKIILLEEHLLSMFREDFEFNDDAGPSHHGPNKDVNKRILSKAEIIEKEQKKQIIETIWLSDAEKELKKIPFFVRGKAKKNTEAYASSKGISQISVETLYEAKAYYAN